MAGVREIEGIIELNDEEAFELFDKQARHYLHMSAEEFLRGWRSGKFAGREDEFPVYHVVKLLPLVREADLAAAEEAFERWRTWG